MARTRLYEQTSLWSQLYSHRSWPFSTHWHKETSGDDIHHLGNAHFHQNVHQLEDVEYLNVERWPLGYGEFFILPFYITNSSQDLLPLNV